MVPKKRSWLTPIRLVETDHSSTIAFAKHDNRFLAVQHSLLTVEIVPF